MTDKCPICDSKGKIIRDKIRGEIDINVYRCKGCFIDFLETYDEKELISSFYENSNYVYKPNVTGEKMKFNEYDERVKRIFPYLSSNTKLLDIGCGDGTFLRMVRPHVSVAEGTEITAVHVENLRRDGFRIWDCLLHQMKPETRYDVICMFALLEHVPKVTDFLEDLKRRFMHDKTQVFIEVPNLLDPLTSCYDIPEYRDFFYRQYHLYYFSEKSLGLLLSKVGFMFECQIMLQASLTNHFHWMHQGKGQATTTDMSNIVLPQKALMDRTPLEIPFMNILDWVDDFYRDLMVKNGIGDLLRARAWIAND